MTGSETECIHDIDTMTCSICKTALGYRPGTNEHRKDCTVKALAELTGLAYSDALDWMREHGRRNGKGMSQTALIEAFEALGLGIERSAVGVMDAGRVSESGRAFLVVGFRGKKGHAWAVHSGAHHGAGEYLGAGTRVRVFEVTGL